jgi:hypothetical protein
MKSNYDNLENELYQKLRPIYPNQDFINRLEERLLHQKTMIVEKRNEGYAIIAVGIGLFIGALFIWMMRRIV